MKISVDVGLSKMAFTINDRTKNIPATSRPGKGKSIISLPAEYVMLDLETTGLSPEWNDIIEIGAIRYRDGLDVDRFHSLVQPPVSDDGTFVNAFIENLTGITNEMLAEAPSAPDVLPRFLEYVKGDIILGYNVGFDVCFLYDKCKAYLDTAFPNDYIDVMRFARKVCPDLPHHRLKDMVSYYGLENEQAHRTISDCEATEQVYRKLISDGVMRFGSNDALLESFRSNGQNAAKVKAADIHGDLSMNNPDCPIYQRHCVITGKLDRFTRAEAMQLIADLGGINDNSVTKNTNYLILGNNDYCATIKGGKSSKQKKAESAKLNGQDIEIIPESVFYDMITEYLSEYKNQDSRPSLEVHYGHDLNANENEQLLAAHFIELIQSAYPAADVALERRSDNYLSLCVNGLDILRFKYTDRTQWLSLDSWSAHIDTLDVRFADHANKNTRHWKAVINDLSDLSSFDELTLVAAKTALSV